MHEFIESIIQNLKRNGFPQKRVSLPTDKMYEAAENKGLNFNKVLEEMKSSRGIESQIGADKIIFSAESSAASPNAGANQEDMIRQAQEMMSQMNPEELRKIQEMLMKMSPEEKEELMKKGKDLGLL
jgi:hypothetical protein